MRLHLASFPLAVLLLAAGCPEDMAKGQPKRPAEALKATLDAAKAGDVERFKAGLSKNFIATVERYQELGKARGELQGAFDWPIFMRSLALSDPAPKEELIQGNKATVKALHADGREVRTQMVLEDGAWKLEVPPGMVRNLDHFDDVEKMVKGEEVKLRPDLPTGGGGNADRVKNLPPDASEAEKAKAAALDAFDLGDLKGAPALLEEALEKNPGDEELVVALGRAYVQSGKGEEAVTLFEEHLKKDEKAVPVRHYLGMAYMMQNRPRDAAAQWQKVMELDAAYASQYTLEQRVKAAKAIAAAGEGKLDPSGHGAPASQPASQPAP